MFHGLHFILHVLYCSHPFCYLNSFSLFLLCSFIHIPFHCPHSIPLPTLCSTVHILFHCSHPIPLFTLHSTVHIPFQSHPFHCSHFIPLATFQSTIPTLHSSSWSGPGLACESHWPKRTHAVMETTWGLLPLQSGAHLHFRVLIRKCPLPVCPFPTNTNI